MTAPETPALSGMSIGAVLDLLRPDFPDVTISKIRFLEAEGLVTPQRAASGYRRFTAYDCARLRFILTAQRDQYLPLKVIKAQLDALPDGELPLAGSPYGVPRLVSVSDDAVADPAAVSTARVRLSREDLLERLQSQGVDQHVVGGGEVGAQGHVVQVGIRLGELARVVRVRRPVRGAAGARPEDIPAELSF